MATRTQAISAFLNKRTYLDLACLYEHDMEVQVNVARDNGDLVVDQYKGKQWRGWTDGLQTWKSFRIPYFANTNPEYEDKEITFDLTQHVEGIGMTGWNWKKRLSMWVAYDFDAMVGHSDKHSKKLTDNELSEVRNTLSAIDYITIRLSTSGKGLHVYIFLPGIPTDNHHEHAALARSILGMLSARTGFNFATKVDITGGNMWVWHRKMLGTDGLKLIKQGEILYNVPPNWRDNVPVITGKRRKSTPVFVEEDKLDTFEELTGQRTRTPLDSDHRRLIDWLSSDDRVCWWWDSDHHMLVTHTVHLKEAHEALGLRGAFDTVSKGTEHGTDHNCFMFPLRRGVWAVRRYSLGVKEAATWDQDGTGWTRCYFNRELDFDSSARINEGVEHPTGGYVFRHAQQAFDCLNLLGANLTLEPFLSARSTRIKQHKQEGKVVVELTAESNDPPEKMAGWLNEKGHWKRVINIYRISNEENDNAINYDDRIRHLITSSGEDCGWVLNSEGDWRSEPLVHIKIALGAQDNSPKEVTQILGSGVIKAWTLVNQPFQPEYPGNRRWNRDAAQLRFLPNPERDNLHHPTYDRILSHLGETLDYAVSKHEWCKQNAIMTGRDYLKVWIASLFQQPTEPLPYLFFYGEQNNGKSMFHEMLGRLMTRGYCRADQALISQAGFNAEIENAVVCVVEETDLKRNLTAYNRIKDWVTSRQVSIHKKQQTPYLIPNSTHWIQTANSPSACPVFVGDTRITMVFVKPLDIIIPRGQLEVALDKEASDFIAAVLDVELPPTNDRLNIPIVNTDEKLLAQESNKSHLEVFIDEECFYRPGHIVKFSDFYDKFMENLDPNLHSQWSKIRVGRELPPHFPKGRIAGPHFIGNMSFDKDVKEIGRYVLRDGVLILETKDDNSGNGTPKTSGQGYIS
jgi:hypothetical protein